MKSIVIVALMLLVLSCNQNKDTDLLVGTWKARWHDKSAMGHGIPGINCRTMDGAVDFRRDGQVNMKAYGHEGCIFMEDTVMHTLNWTLIGDSLQLSDGKSQSSMTYRIVSRQKNVIQCSLIGDIELKLTRN
ncbi:hypothetical protein QQ020_26845 [Fulvivirgaceae bacterium BMA12]|uniref:Lipocalin-like domain-containing protein n=1 Tax=Agaribacillus aureus TaxID=3051825 RepID=A0ABT8LD69_9BACT|nr:hypothetical protein [Fulvivirgaceae bacterium BMA12]